MTHKNNNVTTSYDHNQSNVQIFAEKLAKDRFVTR